MVLIGMFKNNSNLLNRTNLIKSITNINHNKINLIYKNIKKNFTTNNNNNHTNRNEINNDSQRKSTLVKVQTNKQENPKSKLIKRNVLFRYLNKDFSSKINFESLKNLSNSKGNKLKNNSLY